MNHTLTATMLDQNRLFISWDLLGNESYYYLIGMDSLFVSHVIMQVKKNQLTIPVEVLKDYSQLSIRYIYLDPVSEKEIVLDSTDYWNIEDAHYQSISVQCIKSYHGYTFSFYHEDIFDRYYVYEKKDGRDHLIIETEDFQVTSDQFIAGRKYYVEAYRKIDQVYHLKAKSELFTCRANKIPAPNTIFLSIVVPIYNGETFLARTLDSLLLSSFHDKEIILVNDGSTDKTDEIIHWYQKKYKDLVQSYFQENKGLSFARNLGLSKAKGKYVAFIDSDDMVHPYMYDECCQFAVKNNLDAVIGKTIIRQGLQSYHYCLDVSKEKEKKQLLYTFDEMFQEYSRNTKDNIFFVSACNKILKTKIAKEHPFPLFNYYEDTAFAMTAYSYVEKFGFCKKAYYMWDQRFRKTIGTYTTTYSKVNSEVLNRYFVQSLFHVSEDGNPEKLDYLAYYSIVELYNFLTKAKYDLYNNSFADAYIQKIWELGERTNLLNNPYIKKHRLLLSFVTNILCIKNRL